MQSAVSAVSLALLGVVLALVAMGLHRQWDGGAQQSCPVMDNTAYKFLGKVADEDEPCGFLAGGTAPRCKNEVVGLPLRDADDRHEQGDLVCLRKVCTQLVDDGGDCSDWSLDGKGFGNDAACRSGACYATDRTNTTFRCGEPGQSAVGGYCRTNSHCNSETYCATVSGTCIPRIAANQLCDQVDPLTLVPGAGGSMQCVGGHFCTEFKTKRCREAAYGTPGTACPWTPLQDDRPKCGRGEHYCDRAGICTRLVAAGGSCEYLVGGSEETNAAPCEFAHSCHPSAQVNLTQMWVPGTCIHVRSLKAGQAAYSPEFCEWGLVIDPVTNRCTDAPKVGQSCSETEQCITGDLDRNAVSCQCTKANALGGPGRCKKVPLQHPSIPHLSFPEECRSEFETLTTFKQQFSKKLQMTEEGRTEYDRSIDDTLRRGYCCLKSHISSKSHMNYMTGLFAVDFKAAELRCNSDLTWLWIVLAVLGFFTCAGICVVVQAAIAGDEVTPSEDNLPYGAETDDVVKQLINRTTLDPRSRLSPEPELTRRSVIASK